MKKRFQQSLLLLFALLLMPLGVWADREVNQLKFGKQILQKIMVYMDFVIIIIGSMAKCF